MYSGDEFYGDEITSPIERPIPRTKPTTFEAWLARLDGIVQRKVGCSLDDLEDFDTDSAYEDGYTPAAFFREVIAPEVGME
jgi:hypothetical protein